MRRGCIAPTDRELPPNLHFQVHRSVAEVDPQAWNALAEHAPTPLLHHEWLLHLEQSGSMSPERGWQGAHVAAYAPADATVASAPRSGAASTAGGESAGGKGAPGARLVGVAPAYLRDNSWGEFVFDFAWADVAEQIGAPYYPKLVAMSPATPAPGYRFLVDPAAAAETADGADPMEAALLEKLRELARERGAGVLQFNFVEPRTAALLQTAGLRLWLHHGFEWRNPGYASFEEFLGIFDKNQRRNIRRELRSVEEQGLRLRMVPATEAPPNYFTAMADYYRRTNDQFGPYAARFLRRAFFTAMPDAVKRWVWFAAAHDQDHPDGTPPVALSMLLIKGTRMLGRYWGARAHYPNLHFVLCYYLPMQHAIAHGIEIFDPGMGSEHKVRRAFFSVPNYSAHEFGAPMLRAIWDANMGKVNASLIEQIELLNELIPLARRAGAGPSTHLR